MTVEIPGLDDVELLASTANGSVYAGTETQFDRRVAVKVMRAGIDGAERRFARELKSMGRLSPISGIAPVYSSGILDSGEPFIVMPLYQQSLQEVLSAGPLPEPQAVALVAQISEAIAGAHELEVIHLDIKPSNILLDTNGAPFVADFGIAEMTDSSASLSGAMMTPQYAAPERFNDVDPHPAADVYALGATLFALLAGRPPFATEKNTSPAAVMMRVIQDPVPLNELPDIISDPVRDLLLRAMSKVPDSRPTARELTTELARLRDANTYSAPPQHERPVESRRRAVNNDPAGHDVEIDPATRLSTGSQHDPSTLKDASIETGGHDKSKSPIAAGVLVAIAIAALIGGFLLTNRPEVATATTAQPDVTTTTVATSTTEATTTTTTPTTTSSTTVPETTTTEPEATCVTLETSLSVQECEAMFTLVNSPDGRDWPTAIGWNLNQDPCFWDGVTCEAGAVVELQLRNRGIGGEIPPELGNLTNLRLLHLLGNGFTGEIPPELGNLTNVEELWFQTNQLTGEIPPELGNLTNVGLVSFGQNQLSGEIPSELGNMASLWSLSFWNNQLTGEIPPELGNLTNLEVLLVSENPITGEVPAELGNLTNLSRLDLSDTQLAGTLPGTLGQTGWLDIDNSGVTAG